MPLRSLPDRDFRVPKVNSRRVQTKKPFVMNEEKKIKKNIRLYALSTCSHCKAIKKLLQEGSREFDYVDVDLLNGCARRETLAEVRRLNKRCSFPTMVIGDRVIVGFRENDIREALGL